METHPLEHPRKLLSAFNLWIWSKSYGESLTVSMDSRHEAEFTLEILKQAAMTCPAILEYPAPSAAATEFRDGRVLNVRRLGPGDSYGDIALLTGAHSSGTYTALTSGLLLGSKAADLKPILEARPELVESLSYSVAKLQQFVTMFDREAIQPVAIEQRDLLSRIRSFFHLEVS